MDQRDSQVQLVYLENVARRDQEELKVSRVKEARMVHLDPTDLLGLLVNLGRMAHQGRYCIDSTSSCFTTVVIILTQTNMRETNRNAVVGSICKQIFPRT